MRVTLLKSKIHRATVTGAELHYVGSISIAPSLIKRAGLRLNEKVLVADVDNGNRFETYVILGEEGEIRINGAAAHLAKTGDKVIIMAWGDMEESEADAFQPKIVLVDDANQPLQHQ